MYTDGCQGWMQMFMEEVGGVIFLYKFEILFHLFLVSWQRMTTVLDLSPLS